MEIVSVSDVSKKIKVPDYEPLSDAGLSSLHDSCKYGLVLHKMLGIGADDPRPLPMHVHPSILLAMIQEIRRSRGQLKGKDGLRYWQSAAEPRQNGL